MLNSKIYFEHLLSIKKKNKYTIESYFLDKNYIFPHKDSKLFLSKKIFRGDIMRILNRDYLNFPLYFNKKCLVDIWFYKRHGPAADLVKDYFYYFHNIGPSSEQYKLLQDGIEYFLLRIPTNAYQLFGDNTKFYAYIDYLNNANNYNYKNNNTLPYSLSDNITIFFFKLEKSIITYLSNNNMIDLFNFSNILLENNFIRKFDFTYKISFSSNNFNFSFLNNYIFNSTNIELFLDLSLVFLITIYILNLCSYFDTLSLFLFKLKNEIVNNDSNYNDFKKASFFFFAFLLNIIIFQFFFKNLNLLAFLIPFLYLNLITLFSYFLIFDINIFVFTQGLFNELLLFYIIFKDSLTLFAFVSRLILQFVRLLFSTSVVIIFQMSTEHLSNFLKNTNYYNTKTNLLNDNLSILNYIVELLDTVNNFTCQYVNYIVFSLWLIPYLFTFVLKKYKIIFGTENNNIKFVKLRRYNFCKLFPHISKKKN